MFSDAMTLLEWGEFGHAPERKFKIEEICEEIEKQTKVLAGSNCGIIVDKKITLSVYSPNVPSLTLVDLPGITKVTRSCSLRELRHCGN